MFFGILMPTTSAKHDRRYEIVARDRNGEPVKRYQLQHCGNEYDHRSHWYKTRQSNHEHWCPGGPHQHR